MGENGLAQALERLSSAIGHADDDPLIPLSEALFWAFSLEEWHRFRVEAKGQNYYELRLSLEGGPLTAGLMYARGFVVHKLLQVGELVVSGGLPATLPMVLGGSSEYRWVATLPSTRDKYGRDVLYQQHVARRRLQPVLRQAQKYLLTLGDQLGLPTGYPP